MPDPAPLLRDFIYLDIERVASLAAQLRLAPATGRDDESERNAGERLFLELESSLLARPDAARIGSDFDFSRWSAEHFFDGQFIQASGIVRLLDFSWLTIALGGLPAVLRKMNKIEMNALKNSEAGRRMSKTALQQRSLENQAAIAKVEEFKVEELGDVIRQLYGDVVRVKVRSSMEQPQAVLVGSAYNRYFYDSPAALSQKYGIEIDAGWVVVGQLNVPKEGEPPQPIPVGNQMEDSFEQIALLMNNAFKLANAPAFPALSFTPIALYRNVR